MSYIIRQPTVSDAPMLATLARQTFEDAFAAQNTPENMAAYVSVAFTTTQIAQELQDINCLYFVAWFDETPVGYAKLRKNSIPEKLKTPHAIELQRIYVSQQQIGTGVGKQLMAHCLQTARQQNYQTIWLGVWQHNTTALAFYRKWGFKPFGSHIFQLGDDLQTDLLLKLEL